MYSSAKDALSAYLKSDSNVFIHTAAAAPEYLIETMVEQSDGLRNINLYHLHTEGKASYTKPEYKDRFHTNALFVGSNVRKAIKEGRGSYIPVFLSEAPALFTNKVELDLALIQVSPPDANGYCSLGISIDTSRIALQQSKRVIAQVNENMPRTHGDGFVHVSKLDAMVEHTVDLPEIPSPGLTEVHTQIGQNVAELIEDRACLQMGIGAIPNAVLSCLDNHRDLGVHTEMFSDGLLPLIEKGVITNAYKNKHRGKIVSTFLMGSRKLYDFVDDNPLIRMLDCDYVNNTHVIEQNDKVTAINSAIEIDLTGQVCADSIGTDIYSGVGGQMDFIRGASFSKNGKPIIALPSQTKKGDSKIVPVLKQGAGVVTTRSHVHYVVTEYGVADLYGCSLKTRAKKLIEIAHPDHRDELEKAFSEIYNCNLF